MARYFNLAHESKRATMYILTAMLISGFSVSWDSLETNRGAKNP